MFAIVLAAETAGVALLAILLGGVAGGVVTAIFGPYAANRAARNETYRKWQVDLSAEFLNKLAELRPLLKAAQNPSARKKKVAAETALDELDTLAQRVKLIFPEKSGAPCWAGKAAKEARKKGVDSDKVDNARNEFVQCASDEIRSRGVPGTLQSLRGVPRKLWIWSKRIWGKRGSTEGSSAAPAGDAGQAQQPSG